MATRCSEVLASAIPIKQSTTAWPDWAVCFRKASLSPTGSENTVPCHPQPGTLGNQVSSRIHIKRLCQLLLWLDQTTIVVVTGGSYNERSPSDELEVKYILRPR